VSFGGAQPTRSFDDQPTMVIFHLNDYIADPHIDLKPFHTIVFITNDENALRNRLANFNESFTTASILPQWNHLQTQGFVQQNLIRYHRVSFIYLFYIDGSLPNNMQAIFGNQIVDCFSITSRIPAQLREICSMTNDLNIDYCENQRVQNEIQDNIGVANLYATQKAERLDIQLAYNALLLQQFEEQ
jgi:hypothetical protein